jgi:hypothetical protein
MQRYLCRDEKENPGFAHSELTVQKPSLQECAVTCRSAAALVLFSLC